jgi:capsid protein
MAGAMLGGLERAAEGTINFGSDPQISHLGAGENLDIKNVSLPGQQFLPFNSSLMRDMARAIGVTYGGLSMDYTQATYASTRMEVSSIWPIVVRRRERIVAPFLQAIYEAWLDEAIYHGIIPFKGGYEAFRQNKDQVCWAQWQGPAKPTADDLKSAKAAALRIEAGISSIAIEAADYGYDCDEVRRMQQEEHDFFTSSGMRSPYEAVQKERSTVPHEQGGD